MEEAVGRIEGVVGDDLPPGEAGQPKGVRGEVCEMSRSDLVLHRQAVKSRWRQPKRAYRRVPRIMLSLVENSEDERVRVSAAKVLVEIEKQILTIEAPGRTIGDAAGLNVTVNQYAGDGGTITNGSKEALDAAATFIRLMAGDEGESGGAGMVRDEGGVPSPPTLALIESEPA